jgi:hypothetical protein
MVCKKGAKTIRTLNAILLTCLLTLLFTTTLPAKWVQTNGPYGGDVLCFTVRGTNLFTGMAVRVCSVSCCSTLNIVRIRIHRMGEFPE